MLTSTEKAVLKKIIDRCGTKHSCLVYPSELIKGRVQKKPDYIKLDIILQNLEYDGYIDTIVSQRKGEVVFCITLKQRGKGYARESLQSKRALIMRILLAVASATITFFVGKILFLIIG